MSLFATGCCGADFRNDKVTITGLWTLSVPLVYLSAPAAALGPILGEGGGRRLFRVLLTANLDLIRQATLIPGLRCELAGKLYAVSPRLSGLAYRYFNLAVLTVPWACLAAAILLWLTSGK